MGDWKPSGPLMKGPGRRHGEPCAFLPLRKLQRIHVFSLERKTICKQGSGLQPLRPYPPPSSEAFSLVIHGTRTAGGSKLGMETRGGPGLSPLTSGCFSALALRGRSDRNAFLPASSLDAAGTDPGGGGERGVWTDAPRPRPGACALRRAGPREGAARGWEPGGRGRGPGGAATSAAGRAQLPAATTMAAAALGQVGAGGAALGAGGARGRRASPRTSRLQARPLGAVPPAPGAAEGRRGGAGGGGALERNAEL